MTRPLIEQMAVVYATQIEEQREYIRRLERLLSAAANSRDRLRAVLEPLAAIVREWSKDHLGGHIGDDEVYVPCKLLFAAAKALANEQETDTDLPTAEKPCPWCGITHDGACARLISGGQTD